MKWSLKLVCGLMLCLSLTPISHAQNINEGSALVELQAVITAADKVESGRNIILDGSDSVKTNPERKLSYSWDFGDRTAAKQGREVVHTFEKPGTYTISLTISDGVASAMTEKQIFVYEKFLPLFSYQVEQSAVEQAVGLAATKNILLKVWDDPNSVSDLEAVKTLAQNLSENREELKKTDRILIWTKRANIGLNALADFAKNERQLASEDKLKLEQKTFIIITDESLNVLSRIAQASYSVLQPERILLVTPGTLETLISSSDNVTLIGNLHSVGAKFELIDQNSTGLSLWNIVLSLVNYLRSSGVSSETLFLILMLPVIATLIALARQVLGITTMGIYFPIILTLSFVSLGFENALVILLLVWLLGTAARSFFKKVRLAYIPRIALIITFLGFITLLVLGVLSWLKLDYLLQIPIIPTLILVVLVEQILNVQVERGLKASTLLIFETVLVAAFSYFLITQPAFQNFILAYPETVLLLILVNIFLGRWTGLRFTELFRFRQLLDEAEHAEEE